MHVERPFFVSPHALERFRERFGPASDEYIQQLINLQLQPPEIPDGANMNVTKGPALYYAILVGDEAATVVVGAPDGVDITQLPRHPDTWPTVLTVYPGRKHIWQYRARLLRKVKKRVQTKPFEQTWEDWEIETARLMRWIGYTMREIAVVLDRTEKQVERQICSRKIGTVQPRWTEEELQIACDMRLEGKTYAEIGRKLGKSAQAVKIKMLRHRRWVLENPERAAFLRIMSWMKDPGKFLAHLRKTDLVSYVAMLYERLGEEDSAC